MIAARQATDVTLLLFAAAMAVLGLVALVLALLCDHPEDLPEFDDIDDGHSPRSLR